MDLVHHMLANSMQTSMSTLDEFRISLFSRDETPESMTTADADVAQCNVLSKLLQEAWDVDTVLSVWNVEGVIVGHMLEVGLECVKGAWAEEAGSRL